ncbi:MAG: hypothetical protein ACK4M9_12000 [Anaerobacillus sp.]
MADKRADAKSEFKSNRFGKESKSAIAKRESIRAKALTRISKALKEKGMK